MLAVITGGFAVLGVVFAVSGVLGLRGTRRFERDVTEWVPVDAIVVDHRAGTAVSGGDGVTVHHHVVRYRDLGGRERTGTTIDATSWGRQPPGSPMQVRYDPRDPGRVVTGNGGRTAGISTFVNVLFIVLGSLFAVVGIAGLVLSLVF